MSRLGALDQTGRCGAPTMAACRVIGRTCSGTGHDARAEQVGKGERVLDDGLVIVDAGRVVAAEFIRGLGERLVEVDLHEFPRDGIGPESRVGRGQEVGDLVGVVVPAGLVGGEGCRVPRLDVLEQCYRERDVGMQQRAQFLAG